jgi:MFS family permease
MTAASGIAQNFWQIFVLRLGVGVGEASCAPAATSLIGDLFPANWRAKALAIFMLGLPVGVALSFAVSGTIAKEYGWRAAFLVAGVPGLLCAIAVLFIREPHRGAAETHAIGGQRREGSPYLNVLKSPTMIWIILSGAVHNFNMYAIGAFITPFLMRHHGLDIQQANFVSMLVYGVMGAPGLLIGDRGCGHETPQGRPDAAGSRCDLTFRTHRLFRARRYKRQHDRFPDTDGHSLRPDVFLLLDRLLNYPGRYRAGLTRNCDGSLFLCDVRARSLARAIRNGAA